MTARKPLVKSGGETHQLAEGDTLDMVAIGAQALLDDKVDKVAGQSLITDVERNKLNLIQDEATKNATDAALRDRATHTGTQAVSTITGLADAATTTVAAIQAGTTKADIGLSSVDNYSRADYDARFAPISHTHQVAQVTGLGNAATRNVGVASGNVMDAQDLRLFGGAYSGITDPDTITYNSITYATGTTAAGFHDGAIYAQMYTPDQWGHQVFGNYRGGSLSVRGREGVTWTPWKKVWDSGNQLDIGTTAASARAAIGAAPTSHNHPYLPLTGGTLTGHLAYNKNTFTTALDCSLGNVFTKTVTSVTSITITNAVSGVASVLALILVNGGNAVVTWPANIKWAGGVAPELSANGIDSISLVTLDGNIWYGTANTGFA